MGHPASAVNWLDVHFEACRPEYEAMLRSVGIQPGWRVLDAGCGGGSYLPLIAEQVGATGSIVAFDLAPENVAAVAERVAAGDLPCPVETQLGSVVALPFPDDAFDAVWCANTSEFLTDDEFATALSEFRRVVRPGGVVAIKEAELGHTVFGPADPSYYWHMMDIRLHTDMPMLRLTTWGQARGRQMHVWLARAGLQAVWLRTTLIERRAPLLSAERRWYGEYFASMAQIAARLALPEADLAFWTAQRDPSSPAHIINDPAFYFCEGAVVAVGQVPE
jgi:SAM-dependent methyltransferase